MGARKKQKKIIMGGHGWEDGGGVGERMALLGVMVVVVCLLLGN